MIEKEEIEIDAEVPIKGSLSRSHHTDKGTELQVLVGRFKAFEMKFIFDFEFKRPIPLPIQIIGSDAE